MKVAILATIAALALASCQHRHPLSNEEMSAFRKDGDKAILAMDGDMTAMGCGSARYNFINVADQSKVSVKSEAGAGINIAAPGRYRLDNLYCAVWGTGGWHMPANNWFPDVVVKPGEVVYLGTVVVVPFEQTAAGSMLQTPEMKAAWGRLPIYAIRNEFDAARKVLRPEIGDLTDRMVARPLELLLSEKDLADAIARAYLQVNDVKTPLYRMRDLVSVELERIHRANVAADKSNKLQAADK